MLMRKRQSATMAALYVERVEKGRQTAGPQIYWEEMLLQDQFPHQSLAEMNAC